MNTIILYTTYNVKRWNFRVSVLNICVTTLILRDSALYLSVSATNFHILLLRDLVAQFCLHIALTVRLQAMFLYGVCQTSYLKGHFKLFSISSFNPIPFSETSWVSFILMRLTVFKINQVYYSIPTSEKCEVFFFNSIGWELTLLSIG